MGKNNQYINQQREIQRQTENLVPAMYAAMAIVLHEEYGWRYKRINRLFRQSQEVWGDHSNNFIDMMIKCYNLTGIQVMSDKQYDYAVKKGLIKEGD